LWAVRWYLMFPISYRDLELMLLDRGVSIDHTTIFRWIQAYAGGCCMDLPNGAWSRPGVGGTRPDLTLDAHLALQAYSAGADTKGTLIHTDEYSIYARLPAWGYQHKTVCHGRGE